MTCENILDWPLGSLDFSDGCVVMGILNVTPDSFSDGGRFVDVETAVSHGIAMLNDGAAVIDIGAESTRPGAEPVSVDEQIRRAVPVILELSKRKDSVISIDTTSVYVAEAAIEAGAAIINDVSALADDRMAELAAGKGAAVVLMHMQGEPATMQAEPTYVDVVEEVREFLVERAQMAESYGVPAERIFIDPGIGFGKTLEHNLLLMNNIDSLVETGYKVLVGSSRKRFIGEITGKSRADERVFGTAATVASSVMAGGCVVRVHDTAEMADVVKVSNAIYRAGKK